MTNFTGNILAQFNNPTFDATQAAKTCIAWCKDQNFTYHYQPLWIIVLVLVGELIVDGLWRFRSIFKEGGIAEQGWFYGMIDQEVIRRSWNLAKYTLLIGFLVYTLYGG